MNNEYNYYEKAYMFDKNQHNTNISKHDKKRKMTVRLHFPRKKHNNTIKKAVLNAFYDIYVKEKYFGPF